jgi:hypothetical protein
VFGARFANGTCAVGPFHPSCPATGREVEDAVLEQITRPAADGTGGTVVFRFAPTGRPATALCSSPGIPAAGSVRVVVAELSLS